MGGSMRQLVFLQHGALCPGGISGTPQNENFRDSAQSEFSAFVILYS